MIWNEYFFIYKTGSNVNNIQIDLLGIISGVHYLIGLEHFLT